jgi:hypothetical protein
MPPVVDEELVGSPDELDPGPDPPLPPLPPEPEAVPLEPVASLPDGVLSKRLSASPVPQPIGRSAEAASEEARKRAANEAFCMT